MQNSKFLFLLITFVFGYGLAASPLTCPIPLEKGNQWIYEGQVTWTPVGSAEVKSNSVRWVTEVMGSVAGKDIQAAIVRGFPDELAWYEPDRLPGFCIFLNTSNRVYRIPVENEKLARGLAQQLVTDASQLSSSVEELLVLPLVEGAKWGDDPNRDDNSYCWHVEQMRNELIHYKGYSSAKSNAVFTVGYRTLPDHQLIDIAPGFGITRYVYVHHGTVASADLRLVSFKHSH